MKNKGVPYIRRLKATDKADDLRTALRLNLFVHGYGVFRHGYPGICLLAGMSKKDLKGMFFNGWNNAKKFFKERKKAKNDRNTNHGQGTQDVPGTI